MTKDAVWRFRFEDNGEVVELVKGRAWGPWLTKDDALGALMAFSLTNQPSFLCYVLVQEPSSMPRIVENLKDYLVHEGTIVEAEANPTWLLWPGFAN